MANKRQRKKKTTLQLQFQKQRKRIQQAVNRAKKRGYEFPENIIPPTPKRVTKKAIERISNITPDDLYSKAIWVDHSTGEVIEGKEARSLERKATAYKAAQTRKQKQAEKQKIKEKPSHDVSPDINTPVYLPSFSNIIIQNFKADMARFPEVAYPLFMKWLDTLERQYEEDEIADMLEQAKQNGLFPDYTVAYRKDLVLSAISDMMEFLPASQGMKQEIADALEYDDDWELPD